MKKYTIITFRLFFFLATIMFIFGCRKGGCTFQEATNYDKSAEVNDGSCRYKKIIDNTYLGKLDTTQIPNSGFEYWEKVGSPKQEPIHWSSLKTCEPINLQPMAPRVLSRDKGHNSKYSIRIEAIDVLSIPANGIITSGRIHANTNPEKGYVYTDISDSQWNTPFTAKPDSLVGWFKYYPEQNDKGKIEILLHSGSHAQLPRDSKTTSNQIGVAKYSFENIQDSTTWRRFSTPFIYSDTIHNPDYILIVINSGDSTHAKPGTTLWIDDLKLIYK